jgi:hypothetical protein
MPEYQVSKKIGDIGELEILKRLKKKYSNAYIDNKGKANSDWDIFIPEINAGVEVKMDYESRHTGNLVVEVLMFDRPSALSKTKAKYWVFITGERYIWITPLEIYRFIELQGYSRVTFVGNGDTEKKKAYLIKHDELVKYVHGLDKENGWVDMIKNNDKMYYENLLKIDINTTNINPEFDIKIL